MKEFRLEKSPQPLRTMPSYISCWIGVRWMLAESFTPFPICKKKKVDDIRKNKDFPWSQDQESVNFRQEG